MKSSANPVIRLVTSALSFRIRRRARRRNVTYSFLFMKASGDQLRELTPLIEADRIRPVVDTVFSFESARGPAGGPGIDRVPALTLQATLKGALTRQDPRLSLFLTETEGGRQAGRAFLERLKERTHHRDKDISLSAFRAQLKAIRQWGRPAPSDLSER
ncbi:zinc-binding dehydrogenase [Streptomyces sviceus]|uniref:Alpha/beta hydrolase n=1 Tax=Streptomyces sviceus (strain ATCC 29083 / DSM 924 / JCM 4929 / NBRC 13980 / NCIMB 11184 / NRRL 5439 / UC 5370) TaxID=463191 RepID=B5HPH2_STRX2|nr:alpha/beta hydrolase [Streptomyces sviceus ATCC 29083]